MLELEGAALLLLLLVGEMGAAAAAVGEPPGADAEGLVAGSTAVADILVSDEDMMLLVG